MDDACFDTLVRLCSTRATRRRLLHLLRALLLGAALPVVRGDGAGEVAASAAAGGSGNGAGVGERSDPQRRQNARGCLLPRRNLQRAIDGATPGATLTLCPGTWALKKTINVTKFLTLVGAGVNQSILVGRDNVGVLEVAPDVTVTIQDLTITKGGAGGSGLLSGGIDNAGTLTLVGVAVTDNVNYGFGGGIFNSGTLTLVRSNVTRNKGSSGGGIYNAELGTVTLEDDSSVSGNSASNGGGISNVGVLTLKAGCSVSGNSSEYHGGGIANGGLDITDSSGFHEYRGTVTLEAGSSVTGNRAGGAGGGIDTLGTVTLKAGSRVSGNSATDGGGIHVDAGSVHVADSTIVVNNTPNNCAGAVAETCVELI